MTTMQLNYRPSDTLRKDVFAQTGQQMSASRWIQSDSYIEVDPETLTVEQRTRIAVFGIGQYVDMPKAFSNVTHGYSSANRDEKDVVFDNEPTVDQWLSAAEVARATRLAADAEMKIINDAIEAEKFAKDRANAEEKFANLRWRMMAGLSAHEGYGDIGASDFRSIQDAGLDIGALNDLLPQYAAMREEMKAQEESAKAEADAKRTADRLAWAKEHGSDRLRRGLEAGYDCGRQFQIEHAALNYPGFVLDAEDNATWQDRVGPTIAELDVVDAVKAAHPDATTIKLVWLTDYPLEHKRNEEDFNWEKSTAIVVDEPNYKYWLVKEL